MTVSDFVIPILGLLLAINAGWGLLDKKHKIKAARDPEYAETYKEKKRRWIIELIIGFFLMGFSIWKEVTNSSEQQELNVKVTGIQTTLNANNEAITGIGLKIDSFGKVRVVDTARLVNNFTKIITNYITNKTTVTSTPLPPLSTDSSKPITPVIDQKLNQSFEALSNHQYYEMDIALNYIIQNFPKKATDKQLRQITATYPYLKSRNELFNQINTLFIQQGKSQIITDYFKNIYAESGANKLAMDYLFKYDNKLTVTFIDSVIRKYPPYWIRYSDVIRLSMGVNDNLCKQMLNEKDLIEWVHSKTNEQEWMSCKVEVLNSIKGHNSYKEYKETYFVPTYLKGFGLF